MDQRIWDKWLIHNNKRHKDNQLQSLELPVGYPGWECKHDIKESEGSMFNPIFKENVQGRKHPGSWAFAEQKLLSYKKPKHVVQMKKMTIKIPVIVTTIMMKFMMK